MSAKLMMTPFVQYRHARLSDHPTTRDILKTLIGIAVPRSSHNFTLVKVSTAKIETIPPKLMKNSEHFHASARTCNNGDILFFD